MLLFLEQICLLFNILHYNGCYDLSLPLGVYESTEPQNRFDVQQWIYFTDTHIYAENDFNNFRELKGYTL